VHGTKLARAFATMIMADSIVGIHQGQEKPVKESSTSLDFKIYSGGVKLHSLTIPHHSFFN